MAGADLPGQLKSQRRGISQARTDQHDVRLLLRHGLKNRHLVRFDSCYFELPVLRQRLGQQLAAHSRAVSSQDSDLLRTVFFRAAFLRTWRWNYIVRHSSLSSDDELS